MTVTLSMLVSQSRRLFIQLKQLNMSTEIHSISDAINQVGRRPQLQSCNLGLVQPAYADRQ